MHLAPLALVALLLVGCSPRGAALHTSGDAHLRAHGAGRLHLGEVHVKAGADPVTGLDAYTAEDLFQLGYEAWEKGDFGLARVRYARILSEFPSGPFAPPARFNLALSAEQQGQLDDAITWYGDYVTVIEPTDPAEAAAVRLVIARLMQDLERFRESARPLRRALDSGTLELTADWEARTLQARARGRMGEFDQAEKDLEILRREVKRTAVALNESFPREAAMIWFHAAELYRDRAHALVLVDVDDGGAAGRWLEEKAMWLLESRKCFKRTLGYRVPDWSGPAALHVGLLNEEFRQDLLTIEVPRGLDADAADVYRDVLEERTLAFLDKARKDYRWLMRDADDLRVEGTWRDEVRAALDRVEMELGRREHAER